MTDEQHQDDERIPVTIGEGDVPAESAAVAGGLPSTSLGTGQPSRPDVPLQDAASASVESVLGSGEQGAQPSAELKAIIEALIFASPEPLTPKMLFRLLREEPKEDVLAAIAELRADYENRPGLMIEELAGGYQIVTRPGLAEWVRGLFHERTTQRLTIQALETLAVIAYKQPATLPEIIELRGIKSGGVVKTLLERRLIKIVGRKEVVGRPLLYGTTKEFLLQFGLKDLEDLPKIEDFAEILGEDVDVVGLKRALDTPAPVDVPLLDPDPADPAQRDLPFDSSAVDAAEILEAAERARAASAPPTDGPDASDESDS